MTRLVQSLWCAGVLVAAACVVWGGEEESHGHWAFVAPKSPAIPKVRDEKWARNEIDRYILAKLEASGITPSPRADKRTLIRRAYFDLLGLPPTPSEVEGFVADDSPRAYEQLIDRLLDSPHYGERWARYWLDLARYSDTKGYVYADREERRYVHAHVYRDWVVNAFNEDLPYDKFLMRQIAADQIEEGQPRSLAAMGFLTVGRRFLGVIPDIIDDRIDVLMRTTQGLTAACARCHDHKFDPIPTADYYSLYGVLAGSMERTVPIVEHPEPTVEYAAYEAGLHERVKKLQETFEAKKAAFAQRMRDRVAEYFAALPGVEKLPNDDFYEIRDAKDLVPTVVRQWQGYLYERSKRGFDPVFQPWHELWKIPATEFPARAAEFLNLIKNDPQRKLNTHVAAALAAAPPNSTLELANLYGRLLSETEKEWQEAKKSDASLAALPDAEREALRQTLYAADSPVNVPTGTVFDVEWLFEEGSRVELSKLQGEIDRWIITSPGAPPHAVVFSDRPVQSNPRVYLRGNPATKGAEVPRQYLGLIAGERREPFHSGSGRLEMAKMIASRDNPLTARVIVNRIWAHHFGRGLVTTPSDLGTRCPPPTHGELLDYLAVRFMDEGWSLKKLHRLIMLSAAYTQSSADRADVEAKDPANTLLGRMNGRRLDVEAMRDTLLAVAGELDKTIGGKPVNIFGAGASPRRTIYGEIDRQFMPGFYRTFDFANPDLHAPQRPTTTVPQQALYLMNSGFMRDRAQAMARRADVAAQSDPAARIRLLYQILYQREPTREQLAAGLGFVRDAEAEWRQIPEPPPPRKEWHYGYGEYDAFSRRVVNFQPLPHNTGEAWQGGGSWPDAKLGWVQLTATGGHAGNDKKHAAVRRWVAPRDGKVRVVGLVKHEYAEGDGVRAFIVSSGRGMLGQWSLHNQKADASLFSVPVTKGDTLDFAVDLRDTLNSDMFTWEVTVRYLEGEATEPWNSAADFARPQLPRPLTAWEQYAQALMMSNETMFAD